ncbi:hypothetical protein LINPERHAP1_LOCUS35271, partial [Linum perenne]
PDQPLPLLEETRLQDTHHPDDASPGPHIFWDLSRAKFSSGPEPQSGFYIAVVVNREIVLLVGDLTKEAFRKTKSIRPRERIQSMVLRREQVFGNKVYTTKARFGGGNRHISIDCSVRGDARLSFSVDNKKVLQIKRFKWKFRGNERIEVDGVPIQILWDVYNWGVAIATGEWRRRQRKTAAWWHGGRRKRKSNRVVTHRGGR